MFRSCISFPCVLHRISPSVPVHAVPFSLQAFIVVQSALESWISVSLSVEYIEYYEFKCTLLHGWEREEIFLLEALIFSFFGWCCCCCWAFLFYCLVCWPHRKVWIGKTLKLWAKYCTDTQPAFGPSMSKLDADITWSVQGQKKKPQGGWRSWTESPNVSVSKDIKGVFKSWVFKTGDSRDCSNLFHLHLLSQIKQNTGNYSVWFQPAGRVAQSYVFVAMCSERTVWCCCCAHIANQASCPVNLASDNHLPGVTRDPPQMMPVLLEA